MAETTILYSFRRCPFAMRARMAIAVSETPVRLREILLKDKPDEMLAASPKGTVPVLVDGKAVVDESIDVMNWALAKNDPEDWLSRKDDALIAENDGSFKHHLDRYKYSTRYEDADAETHRAAGFEFLQKLEARSADSAYLHGEKRGFSDIAIFPFVRQFRIADKDWFDAAPIPKVQRWLKTLMESPLFKSVMEKHPLWKETGEEIGFPAQSCQ
ncbi:glutathione S-transferase [Hyphococcus luteus]|uniref:Glutathione S-transferase n=1 Tax=Hyphococcus luteus TaxID=2058213 RepID=A0A2S7K2P1_9PROT|nr:glutathione S-transferase [Marinicaulis flavus]PQA86770.1 glutathione S-transferase [Marinicaulis flavus]